MKQKRTAWISLFAVFAITVACVAFDATPPASDPNSAIRTEAPTEAVATDAPIEIAAVPTKEPEYRIEPIEDPTDLPLAVLHADWAEIPVYAVMAANGELLLYTNAYEKNADLYGICD